MSTTTEAREFYHRYGVLQLIDAAYRAHQENEVPVADLKHCLRLRSTFVLSRRKEILRAGKPRADAVGAWR